MFRLFVWRGSDGTRSELSACHRRIEGRLKKSISSQRESTVQRRDELGAARSFGLGYVPRMYRVQMHLTFSRFKPPDTRSDAARTTLWVLPGLSKWTHNLCPRWPDEQPIGQADCSDAAWDDAIGWGSRMYHPTSAQARYGQRTGGQTRRCQASFIPSLKPSVRTTNFSFGAASTQPLQPWTTSILMA